MPKRQPFIRLFPAPLFHLCQPIKPWERGSRSAAADSAT